MRVLHIEYGVGFGGSAISLAELVNGLHAVTDAESVILTFQAAGLNEDAYPHAHVIRKHRRFSYHSRTRLDEALRRRGVPAIVHLAIMKVFGLLNLLYERYLGHYIARLVREHRIDLIHANNGWEMSAMRASVLSGTPCVVHFRGFPELLTGTVRERYGAAIDEAVMRYIGISDSISAAVRAFGAPAAKVVTVSNPVSVAPYVEAGARREAIRARYGLEPHHVVAAVFGRVTSWKGQVEFLDAVRPIMRECADLRVMVVGDGSDDADTSYHERLVELTATPELTGRVILAGFQKDVMGFFAASDIVVHCSRKPEPFGRVVIEAMAARRPIVAMDEGGPPELITRGHDGLLVPPRDGVALAAALRELYADPALRTRLSDAAFATLPERFSATAVARRTYEAFHAIVTRRVDRLGSNARPHEHTLEVVRRTPAPKHHHPGEGPPQ